MRPLPEGVISPDDLKSQLLLTEQNLRIFAAVYGYDYYWLLALLGPALYQSRSDGISFGQEYASTEATGASPSADASIQDPNDLTAFQTAVQEIADTIKMGTEQVQLPIEVADITRLSPEKIKAVLIQAFKPKGVKTVSVVYHDRTTHLYLEDVFDLNSKSHNPKRIEPVSTVDEGKRLARDIYAEKFVSLKQSVATWDPQLQERFWKEIASICKEASTTKLILMTHIRQKTPDTYSISPARNNARKQIDTIVEYIHSLSAPIVLGGYFRRINATQRDAYEFHHTFTPGPGRTTSIPVEFIDRYGSPKPYVIPEWVLDKLDSWILEKSVGLETETWGYFATEERSGTTVITDFIPLPSGSESLQYSLDAGFSRKEDIGEGRIAILDIPRQLSLISQPAAHLIRILDLDYDPNLVVRNPATGHIPVHSHFTASYYQDMPSPPDFWTSGTTVSAVRTPQRGLIFYWANGNDQRHSLVISKPLTVSTSSAHQ